MSSTDSPTGGTQTAEPKRNGRGPRASVQTPGDRKARTLAEALLAVQAAAPKLRKDATGQVQNRTYGYATLDGVLDDIEPLLVEQELLRSSRTARRSRSTAWSTSPPQSTTSGRVRFHAPARPTRRRSAPRSPTCAATPSSPT